MIPSWLIFLFILAFILIFSKKELSIVLGIAAILFGIFVQVDLFSVFYSVFTNPSIIFLAFAVTLIPILGGIMEESGMMLELIQKMSVSKKAGLILTPALFGLLPVAGGALMSAPIVDQIDPDLDPNKKVSANVWYRHAFILIYPLSAPLIVGSYLAGLSLYVVVFALIIPFLLIVLVGYFMILRNVPESSKQDSVRDLRRVFYNLIPLIIAPIIDFIGRILFNISFPEIFLFLGMIISIFVGLKFADMGFSSVKSIAKNMRIWRFPLLIVSMFLFLYVFQDSGVPEEISSLNLSLIILLCIGLFLGFATGRIQLPITILIPIYLLQYSTAIVPLPHFVFLYFSIFLGYLITPLHPCIAYSVDYFETDYTDTIKYLASSAFICFGILLIVSLVYTPFI
jgi:integral membrane protein (TIGR00529 family)